MATKKLSGKQAILYSATKGALIEGDGAEPLADVSWFMINALAAATALPIEKLTAIFKSPDSVNAITPAVGDDVYPLTLAQLFKTDCSISTSKGTIDVTDDGDEGANAYLTDGYADYSGSINGFVKFNDPGGGLAAAQKDILERFFDIIDDDGAGTYTVTSKNDDDLLLFLLWNSEDDAETEIQTWLIIPVILSGTTTDKPLKGGQNLDLTWQKSQGYASVYQRTLNAEDVA